jgi:hypothetical protein
MEKHMSVMKRGGQGARKVGRCLLNGGPDDDGIGTLAAEESTVAHSTCRGEKLSQVGFLLV